MDSNLPPLQQVVRECDVKEKQAQPAAIENGSTKAEKNGVHGDSMPSHPVVTSTAATHTDAKAASNGLTSPEHVNKAFEHEFTPPFCFF